MWVSAMETPTSSHGVLGGKGGNRVRISIRCQEVRTVAIPVYFSRALCTQKQPRIETIQATPMCAGASNRHEEGQLKGLIPQASLC